MIISTIATGEFCVKGSLNELPMKDLQVLPYNLPHSVEAGSLAHMLFHKRNSGKLSIERTIIPNDVKMFAQANIEDKISFYVTSDRTSGEMITTLSEEKPINFRFINIEKSLSENFGVLDL